MVMKIDPNHLSIIAAIVDCGSVKEAAEFLGKSQPSVSRSLSLLEKRIGKKLFEPGRRPLVPTEMGKTLALSGQKVLAAEKSVSDFLVNHQRGKSGIVRMGGTPYFMDGVIANKIAEFQRINPEVEIEQTYGYFDELLNGLQSGNLDIIFCPVQPQSIPVDINFTNIMPGNNVIACRTSHPLLKRRVVTIDDLCIYPWIAPPTGSPLHVDLVNTLAEMGAKDYRISFSGGSLSSALNMLSGTDSLTVLPFSVVFLQKRQYQVELLRVRVLHPERSLGLLVNEQMPFTPVARRLHSFLVTVFETLSQTIAFSEKADLWRG